MGAFVKVSDPSYLTPDAYPISGDTNEEFPFLHTITVVDRVVSVDKPELVQNNIKTETVTLNLDSEWEGLSTVINIGNERPVSVIWSGEPVVIPAELMTTVGSLDVSVVGYGDDGGIRAVTKQAKSIFNVVVSGFVEGDEAVPDPTTLLGQLIQAADNANQAAEEIGDISQAVENAQTSETNAKQSETNAAASAESASQSASAASASASLAGVVSDRVAALSSRVDQLVASGGDGGDVGTELRDVRVTADGIVSGSAGEAVRSQIGLLADRFNMTCRPDARNLLVRSFPHPGFVNTNGFQGALSMYVFFVVGVEPGRKYVFGSMARFVTVYAGDVITRSWENVTEFEAVEGDDRAFVTFYVRDAGSWVMCVDGDDPASVLPYGKVSVNDDRIGELEGSVAAMPTARDVLGVLVEGAGNLLIGRELAKGRYMNDSLIVEESPVYDLFLAVPVKGGVDYVVSPPARLLVIVRDTDPVGGIIDAMTTDGITSFTPSEKGYAYVTFRASDAGQFVLREAGDEDALPYDRLRLRGNVEPPEASGWWDPLRGRKWAVCGDSFTAGDFSGSSAPVIESGRYQGHVATYPWLIASRADMEIQDLALGGRTLATPADGSFSNCFSDGIYRTIAEDADIVTLYFGINDSHHRPGASGSDGEDVSGIIELGTIDDADATTFYGAWNVVVPWILENRPDAHLGIIASNGCETDDYRLATLAIARKWGVPYLDLNGDERTPMMLRSTNPDISSEAKDIALAKWRVGESNQHPNAAAHAFESTVIEHFLRTL